MGVDICIFNLEGLFLFDSEEVLYFKVIEFCDFVEWSEGNFFGLKMCVLVFILFNSVVVFWIVNWLKEWVLSELYNNRMWGLCVFDLLVNRFVFWGILKNVLFMLGKIIILIFFFKLVFKWKIKIVIVFWVIGF